jgi:predicted nucleotidyltransferase
MLDAISIPQAELESFCQRHPVRRLALFGSVLRGDFTPISDIDVLIEFLPGAKIGYFKLVEMQLELSAIFRREVDLRTPEELSLYFRQDVLDGSILLYPLA